ncbi:MAG TPA: GNAT family N-acetyltransferase [Solirubrobacteraceae bacterium]
MIEQSADEALSSLTSSGSQPREAFTADVSQLKVTLAEAFLDDPVFSWLMPDEGSRLARLRRFFDVELRHLVIPRGRAWTSPTLAGAALSLPPGAWHAPPRVGVLQAGCFGTRLHRAAGILALMEMRHIREPHYYFAYIGVAPEAQGQGLGTTLMGPTLERCDREGLPAYLEASSERNAALYERLGFKVTRELRFAGSPPLRLMIRPPRPRQATA